MGINLYSVYQDASLQIVLLGCILSISGYDLSCPHPSQRTMRADDKCNGSLSSYTCLYNTEKKSNIELCASKENFVRAGMFKKVKKKL